MKAIRLRFHILVVLLLASSLQVAGSSKPAADVTGTWSGMFQSRYSDIAPFTLTVVINPDARAHLIGTSTLSSDCVRGDLKLYVTVNGSRVWLAGSDREGANITFVGSIDSTGTLLNLSYVVNASASGRCESDNGTGNLGKR
jgi:hypothetical protein